MLRKKVLWSTAIACAAIAGSVSADPVYDISVYTGPAVLTATSASQIFVGSSLGVSASFTYTGPLNFSDTAGENNTPSGDLNSAFFGAYASKISNYTLISPNSTYSYPGFAGQQANFSTLAGFLASSGSIGGFGYGSFYNIVEVGPNPQELLTLTHDDGVSVYVNGALIACTTAGPTTAITETIAIPASSTGYTIDYVRDNGSPSVLQVSVPEPSTIALFGAGLAGIAFFRRKRTAKPDAVR